MPIKIVCCYAHEDEALLKELKKHLMPMQREGIIDVWHERDISAGTEWKQEANRHLNKAQIILLLVSPNFIASDYCYSSEMKQAMELHKRGKAHVIPVILYQVYWEDAPFAKLQPLPVSGCPITHASHQDKELAEVAQGIKKVIRELTEKAKPVLPVSEPDKKNASSKKDGMETEILIVEDSRPVHELIYNYLSPAGYICKPAYDGSQALSLVQNKPPDLVLLDINMPWMGGLRFIEIIRQRGFTFPIIVMSAAGNATVSRAIQKGANSFILKPFNQKKLLQVIEEVLNEWREDFS